MNKMNACFVSLFTALLFLPVPVCHLPGLRAAALQQGAVLLAVLGEGGHGAAGTSGAGSLLLSVQGGGGGNCSACSLTVWSCAMVCVQFVWNNTTRVPQVTALPPFCRDKYRQRAATGAPAGE